MLAFRLPPFSVIIVKSNLISLLFNKSNKSYIEKMKISGCYKFPFSINFVQINSYIKAKRSRGREWQVLFRGASGSFSL